MSRNKLSKLWKSILGFWLFDKNGNPIEEKKPNSVETGDEETNENLDFLTEKYLISDLFSGSSWKVPTNISEAVIKTIFKSGEENINVNRTRTQ